MAERITRTLGGDRLGSGNKNKISMHNYERSNHDLSYIWRSTMSPGTLVPFMDKIILPADTFDIELDADVMTYPTVGPLFGSFKLQLDIFKCPLRLYIKELHNNMLKIGMNMEKVKLPRLVWKAYPVDFDNPYPIDKQQISSSSILAYLGNRGFGQRTAAPHMQITVNRCYISIRLKITT